MLELGSGSWDDFESYDLTTLQPNRQTAPTTFFPLYGLQNNVGLLTFPNSYYPAYTLGFQNLSGIDDAVAQDVQFPFGYIPQVPIIPDTPSGLVDKFFEAKETLDEFFKKFYIALFALILLAVGLFLLAKSTDTGKAAINLATKL